ncbi:MAG: hypothetical protein D6813_01895 [Calditrichaeota bacterium]|nr:MAG: hypothetical protein D6813_01895 [Calditrichota bacterium]
MARFESFLWILFQVILLQKALMAQNVAKEQLTEIIRQSNSKFCTSYTTVKSLSTQDSSKQAVIINPVPVLVFGLAGMFLGAWAGHSIENKDNIPGEPREFFTKGTVTRMSVGLIAGGIIGYFLGREKVTQTKKIKYEKF